MTIQSKEELFACPECKSRLHFGDNKINCLKCNIFFTYKDGIYHFLPFTLDDYDQEQRAVFDKISSGYDMYLNAQPFYTLIRDNYVYPFWFKDDFHNKTALDIGCGTGWASAKALSMVKLLVNLDISLGNLTYAQQRLKAHHSLFVQSDMKQLPFSDNSFDIVTCFWALHHIKDIRIVVEEIKRILRKDGVFLGIEPNPKYSWVEYWSDTMRFPNRLRDKVLQLHRRTQIHSQKHLIKEESYMQGIHMKYDHHAGMMNVKEYKSIFEKKGFKFVFQPVGLEMLPPRMIMSKNKKLVKILLDISDKRLRLAYYREKAYFNIIRAQK